MSEIRVVLTIAGSDSSGGAGIQADIKTMMANGVYAMSAITALTAQNTRGVTGIMEVTPEFLAAQLDTVFTDIPPDAVKIGMVASEVLVEVIADRLSRYGARNIVVDPVMVATSGANLIHGEAVAALRRCLLPMASVVTPNIPEAEVLADLSIHDKNDMVRAAEKISGEYHCAVLCKGGHGFSNEATLDVSDFLCQGGRGRWFASRRIDSTNTHGTGCTLSSAIAAGLAKGETLPDAVEQAKEYVSGALEDGMDLGGGNGPLNHGYRMFQTRGRARKK